MNRRQTTVLAYLSSRSLKSTPDCCLYQAINSSSVGIPGTSGSVRRGRKGGRRGKEKGRGEGREERKEWEREQKEGGAYDTIP